MLISGLASADGDAPTAWSVPRVLKTGPGCSTTNGAGARARTSASATATAMDTQPTIVLRDGATRSPPGRGAGLSSSVNSVTRGPFGRVRHGRTAHGTARADSHPARGDHGLA